jgi:sodium/pantothenate symporter
MTACLAVAIGLALLQPPLIQWIIFFSIGGLEAATFGPILLGMFWKRGNKWGATASICWGMLIYGLANTVIPEIGLWGTHPSLISVVSSMIVYVAVSLATPPPSEKIVMTFWGLGYKQIR